MRGVLEFGVDHVILAAVAVVGSKAGPGKEIEGETNVNDPSGFIDTELYHQRRDRCDSCLDS